MGMGEDGGGVPEAALAVYESIYIHVKKVVSHRFVTLPRHVTHI